MKVDSICKKKERAKLRELSTINFTAAASSVSRGQIDGFVAVRWENRKVEKKQCVAIDFCFCVVDGKKEKRAFLAFIVRLNYTPASLFRSPPNGRLNYRFCCFFTFLCAHVTDS
jgi:hypothetical protein